MMAGIRHQSDAIERMTSSGPSVRISPARDQTERYQSCAPAHQARWAKRQQETLQLVRKSCNVLKPGRQTQALQCHQRPRTIRKRRRQPARACDGCSVAPTSRQAGGHNDPAATDKPSTQHHSNTSQYHGRKAGANGHLCSTRIIPTADPSNGRLKRYGHGFK